MFKSNEKNSKILYMFITHEKNYSNVLERCKDLKKNYVIVVGGFNENLYIENSIFLDVVDTYDGLPEKVFSAFKFIFNNSAFEEITHICKLDEDMIIKKTFSERFLKKIKYAGNVQYVPGRRDWGRDKFPKKSKFSNQNYEGIFVPWCLGGYGYILSREAFVSIQNQKIDFENEPYEDLLFAKLFNNNKIYPFNIKNLENYIYSPSHKS